MENDKNTLVPSISHDRSKETLAAKAEWFQSLSVEERIGLFCEITELALQQNPDLGRKRHVEPVEGRICVLSLLDLSDVNALEGIETESLDTNSEDDS